jgi:hypothetical protein
VVVASCAAAPPAATALPPVPLADRQIAVLELPGSPDWLVADFGSVWAHRDDGNVIRIDPKTQAVTATIDADVDHAGLCQGLGTDGTAIWTCSGADIVRIDPATNRVSDTVKAGKIFGQGRLVTADEQLWVITGENGDELAGYDLDLHALSGPFDLGAPCGDLAVGAGATWLACPAANLVLRFDPDSTLVTDRITVAAANQISAAQGAVWVGSSEGIVRIDAATKAARLAVPGLVPGDAGSVWASPSAVWVRTTVPFLTRIDPASGRVVETITAPEYGRGGDVIGLGEELWASDSDDGVVIRLRP